MSGEILDAEVFQLLSPLYKRLSETKDISRAVQVMSALRAFTHEVRCLYDSFPYGALHCTVCNRDWEHPKMRQDEPWAPNEVCPRCHVAAMQGNMSKWLDGAVYYEGPLEERS